jgi:hypothetical protein
MRAQCSTNHQHLTTLVTPAPPHTSITLARSTLTHAHAHTHATCKNICTQTRTHTSLAKTFLLENLSLFRSTQAIFMLMLNSLSFCFFFCIHIKFSISLYYTHKCIEYLYIVCVVCMKLCTKTRLFLFPLSVHMIGKVPGMELDNWNSYIHARTHTHITQTHSLSHSHTHSHTTHTHTHTHTNTHLHPHTRWGRGACAQSDSWHRANVGGVKNPKCHLIALI